MRRLTAPSIRVVYSGTLQAGFLEAIDMDTCSRVTRRAFASVESRQCSVSTTTTRATTTLYLLTYLLPRKLCYDIQSFGHKTHATATNTQRRSGRHSAKADDTPTKQQPQHRKYNSVRDVAVTAYMTTWIFQRVRRSGRQSATAKDTAATKQP